MQTVTFRVLWGVSIYKEKDGHSVSVHLLQRIYCGEFTSKSKNRIVTLIKFDCIHYTTTIVLNIFLDRTSGCVEERIIQIGSHLPTLYYNKIAFQSKVDHPRRGHTNTLFILVTLTLT